MPAFLTLIRFTEQGAKGAKQSPERAKAFAGEVEAAGGRVRELLWTIGSADGAIVFEAPSEAVAAELLLGLSSKGNVRTETLPAFNVEEFSKMTGKL